MYSERIEALIQVALADGELSEKEKLVLFKCAAAEGIDLEELEMVLQARLIEMKNGAKPSAPKSDKLGKLQKCPACGAIISGGEAVCKECGYAFSGVGALLSREKLYEALQAVDQDNTIQSQSAGSILYSLIETAEQKQYNITKLKAARKATIIMNFPVPNTRGDLLDFLAFLANKADPKARRDYMSGMTIMAVENLGYAYWVLFESCITKARINFGKDADFSFFFEKYTELKNKSKGFFERLFS